MEKEFRDKEKIWLVSLPGVPNATRSVASSRLDLLIDALDTVVLGVDSKVYTKQDDLLEARRNLLEKYHRPYSDALLTVRSEVLLTWTQELIQSLDTSRESEKDSLDASASASWDAARSCLTTQETVLLRIHDGDTSVTATDLGSSMRGLSACQGLLSELPLVKRSGSGSTVTP